MLGLSAAISAFSLVLVFRQHNQSWPAVFLVALPLLLLLLFATMRLDTEIRTDGIYVRFFPAGRQYKKYAWEDLEQLFVRQYEPIREYGGWGIRGGKHNRAYNISGNQGLQLIFKDKKRVLIGTKRPDELAALLASLPPSRA